MREQIQNSVFCPPHICQQASRRLTSPPVVATFACRPDADLHLLRTHTKSSMHETYTVSMHGPRLAFAPEYNLISLLSNTTLGKVCYEYHPTNTTCLFEPALGNLSQSKPCSKAISPCFGTASCGPSRRSFPSGLARHLDAIQAH